ncbi:MAG: PAS domain-containing sensor histidine kinase [Cyclobacteriaceae bacterium]
MIPMDRLFASIIEATDIGICVLDKRNKIIEVNEAFCRMYGYTQEEIINKPYSLLQPENYRERATLLYQNYISGQHQNGNKKILSKDGQLKDVYCSVSLFEDENGDSLKVYSFIDVSGLQKMPETPVQEQPTGLNLRIGLLRCSSEGQLLFANPFARNLLFLSAGAKEMNAEVTTYSGTISRTLPLLQFIKDKRSVDHQEVLLHRADQPASWVLLSASTVIGPAGEVCFDLSLTPIDEQKKLEKKLSQRVEELQVINQRLDHFVYGATHDIKAPLASLSGLLYILRRENDPAQKEMFMQMMEKSIHRLNEFIREIIDYSRNSSQVVRHELIHFGELIEEVFESMSHMENAPQIQKIFKLEQNRPFYSDARRIKVVLSNLVSNAYRYSSTHRRDCFVEINVKVEHEKAIMMVRDNGQGIDKNYLEKIFDMFFRASEGQGGTGLGLYIVKETLDKMGGTIHVASELGKGTSFVVNLPLSRPDTEGAQMELDM